jgi:hypothetical protein
MKMPILPQLASSVFITLVCLLVAPTIAQAKRDIEGQVFIVTKGSENVKLGLVPIWLVSDSEMKDLAKQAVEMANATSLKEEVDKMVKEVDAVEAKAEKELSSEAFQKVKLAAGEEKQAILKSFDPFLKLAQRGESLINKLEKQKQGIDTGEIFSKVMLHSEFSIKIMIGLLSEKESDVESDADGKFKLSVDGNTDWVVAYSQRTLGRIGQSELRNSEQYYWLLEVPKKKSQLFLSSNNCDISDAEAKLRSIALQDAPGLFGASKKLLKENFEPIVAGKGETQKVYGMEKSKEEKIKEEKERTAAAERAERALSELVRRLEAKMLPVPGTKILLSKTEFTVGEWKLYLKARGLPDWKQPNAEFEQNDEHPVVKVCWYDAKRFCDWLSEMTGKEWRLPTNSEWGAAVGTRKYPWGDYYPPKWDDGNYAVAKDGKGDPAKVGVDGIKGTAPVGSFKANVLGFYDLGGNVNEWMWDLDEKTGNRVIRGGYWYGFAEYCTVAFRFNWCASLLRHDALGFRVALSSVP